PMALPEQAPAARPVRLRDRRRFLLVAVVTVALLGFFGFRYARALWIAWRIHRPECIVWTGNYAVGVHRGIRLWGVDTPGWCPQPCTSGLNVLMEGSGPRSHGGSFQMLKQDSALPPRGLDHRDRQCHPGGLRRDLQRGDGRGGIPVALGRGA